MSRWAHSHLLCVPSTFAEGLTQVPLANRKLKSNPPTPQEAGNKGLNAKVSGDPLTVIVYLKSSPKEECIVKSLNLGKRQHYGF